MKTDDQEMENQDQNQDLKPKKPKSKKRAQLEQLSKYKVTDFYLGSQNQPKLQGNLVGGDAQPNEDHVTQILRAESDSDSIQISPLHAEKKSTAPSQSPLGKELSKDSTDPHPEDQMKENKIQVEEQKIVRASEDKNSQSLENSEFMHDQGKMEESHDKKGKVQNRDHCNICKDGGDLICCDHCPRSFHLKCLKKKEEDIPDGDWYCDRCRPIVTKKKQQEQDRRKKAQEREKAAYERKKKIEEDKKKREQEAERKREEKRRNKQLAEEMKIKQKQQELEQLKLKNQQNDNLLPDQPLPTSISTIINLNENKIEGPNGDEKRNGGDNKQEGISPNIAAKKDQKKAKSQQNEQNKQSKDVGNQRKNEEKNEVEKQKEQKAQLVKQMFKLFSSNFPELVEKNQIKYPIKDELIQKMPLLHGAENISEKPIPKKVLLEQIEFENLLYVWEFCNNFQDFLNSSPFKIEELQASLKFCFKPEEVKLYNYENPDNMSWDEKVTVEAVKSGGFGLVNSLFMAFINKFMENYNIDEKTKAAEALGDEDQNHLLIAIKQNIEKLEEIWPEVIRLIIKDTRKFIHQEEQIDRVNEKLINCNPSNFNYILSYEDKIEILQYLVDKMHESDDFRSFLNSRIEEKSGYTKQKMELYAEIKQLEQEKQELIKKHANSDYVNNSEQILSEISKLKEQLMNANRVESKRLKEQIAELEYEKNKVIKETDKIDDQVVKKHAKIDKLNEQILQTSIKNQMLGKDANRNEYWFFKEEPQKIFVKIIETVQVPIPVEQDQEFMDEQMFDIEERIQWSYYDEEDEFIKLIESMNPKGVREKKLQENLKKIGDRLKLKKSKKSQNKEETKDEEVKKKDQTEENVDQTVEKPIESEKMEVDEDNSIKQTLVFENDDYEECIYQAIWFERKKPPKKKDLRQKEFRNLVGRKNQDKDKEEGDDQMKMEINSIKKKILSIEQFYSEISLAFSREWEKKEKREAYIKQIEESDKISEIALTLVAMDAGFCYPHALRYKENQDDPSSHHYSGSESDEEMEDAKHDEYKNVKRFKLKLFKFWNPKELRSAWRDYLQVDCGQENINALFIAVKLLDKNTNEFAERQFDNKQKKQQKEEKKNKMANNKQDYYKLGHKQNGINRKDKTDYKQFFESSSDDDDSEKKANDKPKGRGRGRPRKSKPQSDSEMEVELESEDADEESEEEEGSDEDRQWDHKCYVCKKGGNLMCCEGCTHVAHTACVGLKKVPSGDWHCEQCLYNQSQRRTTRKQVQQQNRRTDKSVRAK